MALKSWTTEEEMILRAAIKKYRTIVDDIIRQGMPYEDVLQELRIRIYRKARPSYDEITYSTALYRIIYTGLIALRWKTSRIKNRLVHEAVSIEATLEQVEEWYKGWGTSPSPEEEVISSIYTSQLMQAVRDLLLTRYSPRDVDLFLQSLVSEEPVMELSRSTRERMKKYVRERLSLSCWV